MLDALINMLVGNVVVDVEIQAKQNNTPASNDMTVLGPDGRSYTVSYRKKMKNGSFSAWTPVKLS